MIVEGHRDTDLSPAQLWEALSDPGSLSQALPGCQGVERTEPARVALTVAWQVASLEGVYEVDVTVADVNAPTSCALRVEARGERGSVDAGVQVTLVEHDGGTRVGYRADVEVSGELATVGARVVEAATHRLVEGLIEGVEQQARGPGLARPPVEPDTPHVTLLGKGPPGASHRAWGPPAAGPPGRGVDRLVLGALAGAAVALLIAWLAGRARR